MRWQLGAAARRAAVALVVLATALATAGPGPAWSAGPPRQVSDAVVVAIEGPLTEQSVAGEVAVRGWALDRRATDDSGIRSTPGGVQVWLDRTQGSATGQFLGDAV